MMQNNDRPPRRADETATQGLAKGGRRHKRWLFLVGLAVLLVALAAHWASAPPSVDSTLEWLAGWRTHPAGPALMVLTFGLLGFVSFPVTVLIGVSGLLFAPATAVAVSGIGVMASAAILFLVGRRIGTASLRRFEAGPVQAAAQRLARQGIVAVAVVRNIPLFPFTVVNLVCGSSPMRFRDFLIGTAFGMTPAIIALTFFGSRLDDVVTDPNPRTLILLGLALVVVLAAAFGAQRLAARRNGETEPAAGTD